ncbi:Axonemal dynein light chain domain-containing protein 1 [Thoreauomyces humboldtii]|nr:Axonemal dynein light chain domain-containing protein 1 [Thoreauomyces humboldtii]
MSYIPTALLSDLSRLSSHGGAKPVPLTPKKPPVQTPSTRHKIFSPPTAGEPIQDSLVSLVGGPSTPQNPHNSTRHRPTTQGHVVRQQGVQGGDRAGGSLAADQNVMRRTPPSRLSIKPNPGANNDLAFVYEAPGQRGETPLAGPVRETGHNPTTATSHSIHTRGGGGGGEDGGITMEGLTVVAPGGMSQSDDADNGTPPRYAQNGPVDPEVQVLGAAMKPVTRKEVALLKFTMQTLIKEVGAEPDSEYPTEMHAFLAIIQEEQKIYDAVFQELIRQVTVNMIERGEVLGEIRNRYANMFTKIPKHVRNLHIELVAQRKLNRRLSHELLHSKETVAELVRELGIIRKHDMDITKQAEDSQEKLVSVLTQSDNTEEILEEYHKLYRMQRDRLEDAVRLAEQEKRIWVEAATALALRIGQEHGIADLVLLQKYEHARLRASNHVIVIVSNTNDSQLRAVERKIDDWRAKLIRLSQSVVEEDQHNIETLAKMQRDMEMVMKNLETGDTSVPDTIDTDHPLLKAFAIHDVKSLSEYLMKWVEQITAVAVRFTSDRDLVFQEEIATIRKETEAWVEACYKLLRRNERNTNGAEYAPLGEFLSKIGEEVQDWLTKLDQRVSGEDGIASHVISLQNQLEDRYTTYGTRDTSKPLPLVEKQALHESLYNWTGQIGKNIIDTLSNTTEKEQHKIPLHVENLLSRLLDQLNTDTDVRNEENIKLHTSLISWMVHLLVKAGSEKPTDAWDHSFTQLTEELGSFNNNLLRDCGEIDTTAEDGKNLKESIRTFSSNWTMVAKRLLASEKANATEFHSRPVRPLSAKIDDFDDDLNLVPPSVVPPSTQSEQGGSVAPSS